MTKQAFGVRLRGFESGYADKHRAREKRRGNLCGHSRQPRSRRTRGKPDQGAAVREKQRLERGSAFLGSGEQVYRRKRLGSLREMAPGVRHRGERRDQESLQIPLWGL